MEIVVIVMVISYFVVENIVMSERVSQAVGIMTVIAVVAFISCFFV